LISISLPFAMTSLVEAIGGLGVRMAWSGIERPICLATSSLTWSVVHVGLSAATHSCTGAELERNAMFTSMRMTACVDRVGVAVARIERLVFP